MESTKHYVMSAYAIFTVMFIVYITVVAMLAKKYRGNGES